MHNPGPKLSLSDTCRSSRVSIIIQFLSVSRLRFNQQHTSFPFTFVSTLFMKHPKCQTLLVTLLTIIGCAHFLYRSYPWEKIMDENIKKVVAEYEECLRRMQFVPKFSYGCWMLCADGAPNRIFLTYLFSDQALAIQFLKDVGLIQSKVQCNTCDQDTTWSAEPNHLEGFRWRCQRRVAGARCRRTASIKHGSWFQQSNLTFPEINHSLYFVHPDTGDHTNTIESTWHCVKAFLGPYNRGEDYHYHLAYYMFMTRCKAQGIPPFLQFIHLITNIDWSNVDFPLSSAPVMRSYCRGPCHTSASPQTGTAPHNSDHL